jgi:putative SOS response-associated peptidase YedK
MCGRVIQSSAPFRFAIVEGLDVGGSRFHNYPPRWNGAPSQELLVIRRDHHTGELSLDPLRWGLIPYWCEDPKGGRKPINAKAEMRRRGFMRIAVGRNDVVDSISYTDNNFGDQHHTRMSINLDKVKIAVGNGRGVL